MAGVLLGRHKAPCISCGFAAPHVKRNEGKLPYVHCPDCGLMCSAKNQQQARGLLANMRAEIGATLPEPPATDQPIVVKASQAELAPAVSPAAVPAPAPAEPPRKASPWATLLDLKKQ